MKKIDKARRPVAMVQAVNDHVWQGSIIVVCDDGSMWAYSSTGWAAFSPVPGTEACATFTNDIN